MKGHGSMGLAGIHLHVLQGGHHVLQRGHVLYDSSVTIQLIIIYFYHHFLSLYSLNISELLTLLSFQLSIMPVLFFSLCKLRYQCKQIW